MEHDDAASASAPPEPDGHSDEALIQRTLQGDTSAYGLLVRRYQDRLFNTVAHLVGGAEDARDVVQDAFVQAFVKLETFKGHAAFYTWLYRIGVNLAIGFRRKRRPSVSMDRMKAAVGVEPEETAAGPCDTLESDERVEQVRRAIDRLSDEHREVLVLREMEGFCYEEIAHILQVAVGTVRSRLHRARLALREELDGLYGEGL